MKRKSIATANDFEILEVYQLSCNDSTTNKSCIGQTGSRFKQTFKEHIPNCKISINQKYEYA